MKLEGECVHTRLYRITLREGKQICIWSADVCIEKTSSIDLVLERRFAYHYGYF